MKGEECFRWYIKIDFIFGDHPRSNKVTQGIILHILIYAHAISINYKFSWFLNSQFIRCVKHVDVYSCTSFAPRNHIVGFIRNFLLSLNTVKKNATATQYELMSVERRWERERTTQIESRSTRSLNSVPALFASRNDAGTND